MAIITMLSDLVVRISAGDVSRINPHSYKFTFGKYKGKTYDYVVEHEPTYILWAHRNVEWFRLDMVDYMDLIEVLKGRPYRLRKSAKETPREIDEFSDFEF